MTKDKNKNIIDLESRETKKINDIKTETKETTEPTISDALKSAINEPNYLNKIVRDQISTNGLKLNDIVKIIMSDKNSHAYKHSLTYGGYGQSPIDNIKITMRVSGWVKHYGHILKTTVKHGFNVVDKDGEAIKTGRVLKNDGEMSDFKLVKIVGGY